MTREMMDRLMKELTQNHDWPAVMKQIQEWLETDDPQLDALFEYFAKITPRNVREVRIKAFLLFASLNVLVLSRLNGCEEDSLDGEEFEMSELSELLR